MSLPPPVPELEFLKLSGNHAELVTKLSSLNCSTPIIREYAKHVCEAWFNLGIQHLNEAKAFQSLACPRAIYSRSYYAAYNTSKAVRYMVQGQVSLKGDDHKQASSLPDDFPDVANWSSKIGTLYQNRLRADYDNWISTQSEFSNTTSEAITIAEEFVNESKAYLNSKFGLTL